MDNHPRVGVCVIVRYQGRVLFGKRKGKHGTGTWAAPGGHLEFGESWEEGALRELEEEVGIIIANLRFVTATNDIFSESKHYITLIMVCDYVSGVLENKEPDKCEGWQWVDWHNLPQPVFLTVDNLFKLNFDPLLV